MPLHPIVVHFPIAGAVLAPPILLLAFWAVRTGRLPRTAWWIPAALQAMSLAGALVALETGEDLEEADEGENHQVEIHEGHAQRLTAGLALGTTATVAAALLPLPLALPAEIATLVLGLGGGALALPAGHSGGQMVWGHEDGDRGSQGAGEVESSGDPHRAAETEDDDD